MVETKGDSAKPVKNISPANESKSLLAWYLSWGAVWIEVPPLLIKMS